MTLVVKSWRNVGSALVVLTAVAAVHAQALFEPEPWQQCVATALLLCAVVMFGLLHLLHLCAVLFLAVTLSHAVPQWVSGVSTLYLAVVFGLSSALVFPFKAGRESLRWLRTGHVDRTAVVFTVAVALVSGIALIVWGLWTDELGAGEQMAEGFASYPRPLVFLVGVPLFALLNAFSEEAIFRGVFQEAALRSLPSLPVALTTQAMAFAAVHFRMGFPNGAVGYAMVLVYGLMLGWLRWRSNGMLLPFAAHVLADLVIAYFLCFSLL